MNDSVSWEIAVAVSIIGWIVCALVIRHNKKKSTRRG